MIANYWDPKADQFAEVAIASWREFAALLTHVESLGQSPRGFPAIDVIGDNGVVCSYIRLSYGNCTLAVGDGDHTRWPGPFAHDGETVSFDYMGSWSEVPDTVAIGCDLALAAVRSFIETGAVDPGIVELVPE